MFWRRWIWGLILRFRTEGEGERKGKGRERGREKGRGGSENG